MPFSQIRVAPSNKELDGSVTVDIPADVFRDFSTNEERDDRMLENNFPGVELDAEFDRLRIEEASKERRTKKDKVETSKTINKIRITPLNNTENGHPLKSDNLNDDFALGNVVEEVMEDMIQRTILEESWDANEKKIVDDLAAKTLADKKTIDDLVAKKLADACEKFDGTIAGFKLQAHLPTPKEKQKYAEELREKSGKPNEHYHLTSKDKSHLKITSYLKTDEALKDFSENEENEKWFIPMLTACLQKDITLESLSEVGDKERINLVETEGYAIGSELRRLMKVSRSSEIGVADWILSHQALKTLDKERNWFRPMLVSLANFMMPKHLFGLQMRVYTGLAISVFDMVTDLIMIYEYAKEGNMSACIGQIIFVLINTAIQLTLVWAQTKNKGWLIMLREMLFVVLQIKPAVDAYRVTRGIETDDDVMLSTFDEMLVGKVGEIFGESIGSTVMQMYYLSKSAKKSKIATGSLMASIMATGYGAALVNYNFDTSQERRAINPDFYGFILDANRNKSFFLMCMTSSSQILIQSSSLVLMYSVSPTYASVYYGSGIVLFILLKAVRKDFRYWLDLDGFAGFGVSAATKIVFKVIADFTGLLQARHPYELGGLGFMCNTLWSHLGLGASVMLYIKEFPSDDPTKLPTTLLICLALGAWLMFMISYGLFFLSIDKKYIPTFFTTVTAKEFCCANFQKTGVSDEEKFEVFGNHRSYYEASEDEIKAWLVEKWPIWIAEKPSWFTKGAISRVPLNYLPASHKGERKASVTTGFAGIKAVVRQSMKENGNKKSLGGAVGNILGGGNAPVDDNFLMPVEEVV